MWRAWCAVLLVGYMLIVSTTLRAADHQLEILAQYGAWGVGVKHAEGGPRFFTTTFQANEPGRLETSLTLVCIPPLDNQIFVLIESEKPISVGNKLVQFQLRKEHFQTEYFFGKSDPQDNNVFMTTRIGEGFIRYLQRADPYIAIASDYDQQNLPGVERIFAYSTEGSIKAIKHLLKACTEADALKQQASTDSDSPS
ncbi:hypothetical protein [Balneatrix alpica]|uniref:Uncharacterized protein n=1 Tax=Balneatrix alpica TaxID=75684 RepID=A0ABV5ZDW3_9GAMM|nr:hypothetical protein [Balneatrix alpica]